MAALGSATATSQVDAARWTQRQLSPVTTSEGQSMAINLSGVSCPTESLCVAVGGREGTLAFSHQPTGGAESWRWTRLAYPVGPGKTCVVGDPDCEAPSGALQAASCASASLCALVTYDGWIFVSTDPGGGSGAWTGVNVNAKGQQGATHLMSVSCPSPSFCAAVSGGSYSPNAGRVLTSSDPASGDWQTAELGSQLDLRSISCGTPSFCILFTSTNPGGGASAWRPTPNPAGDGDLEGASCPMVSLCALVGRDSRIFTSTDPFSTASDGTRHHGGRKTPRRPQTILVFAEHFWSTIHIRRRHVRARFRFYAPARVRGFECKRDRGPYRRCRSPLRYWVGHGRHVLRVRAIGPTGLRGPAAIKRFRVYRPRSR
jgi:hypothetical protein